MRYLLDTNVISELLKPRPSQTVKHWIATADEDALFLSVITLTELREGVDRMPQGQRRSRLQTWLVADLRERFRDRLVEIDERVADCCGSLHALSVNMGRPASYMDAFLAATAQVHAFTLVTRNVKDFELFEIALINPCVQRQLETPVNDN